MSTKTETVPQQNNNKSFKTIKQLMAVLLFCLASTVENSALGQALNCKLDKTNTACYETIIEDSVYDDPRTQYTQPLSAVYTTQWKKK